MHAFFEEIFDDILWDNLLTLSKENLQSCCNVLKLKVSEEKKGLMLEVRATPQVHVVSR